MADPGNRKSRNTEKSGKFHTDGRRSNQNQNRPDPSSSDDSSQHKSSQTEKIPVHHVAVQWENHTPRGMETTDRRTSDNSVQSAENSRGVSDNHTTDKSSLNVVNNKGPVQLGTGSTVINNPTYYNIHHHHYPSNPSGNYIRSASHQQASLASGLSHSGLPSPVFPPNPPAVEEAGQGEIHHVHHYPNSDYNETMPTSTHVPILTSSSVQFSSHHPLKQLFQYARPPALTNPYDLWSSPHTGWRGNSQQNSSHLPHFQQQPRHPMFRLSTSHVPEEQKVGASTERREYATLRMGTQMGYSGSSHQFGDQIPSSSTSRPPTDIPDMTCSRSENSNENKENAPTRQASGGAIQDSVRIMDSKGQVLQLGDAVVFGSGIFNARLGVYVGHQEVVFFEEEDKQVKKEKLDLTQLFCKLRVISMGRCRVFRPEERVRRAVSRAGACFTEGDICDGSDFPYWVYTDLGGDQAEDKGFRLDLD